MRDGEGRGRAILVLALAALVAWQQAPARADDASEAQLHFELGATLYGQRRYAEALEHFLASNRLVPNPSVTFNIAQTYGLMGRWVDAFNWYETYSTQFELDPEAQARGAAAQDAARVHVAVIAVATEPRGATLYVDRVELGSVGTSPREVAVAAGEHTLLALLEGHRDAAHAWTAAAGERVEASLTLEPILGRLAVHTEPSGAEVLLEGSDAPLGTTPLEVSLGVGPQRLVVRHEGYGELTRSVTIVEAETARLDLTLSRLAATVAVLSVIGPEHATVALDGVELGAVPLTLDALAPGTHRVRISQAGRSPWSEQLVFEAGGVTRISAVLSDPSALHFEELRVVGYVVGGLAVAAGAGVAAGAYAEREAFFADANPTRARYDLVGTLNTTADVLLVSGLVVLAATLIADLAIGPRPRSRAEVVVDR